MEYSNEFISRVFASHMGANMIFEKSGRVAKLHGVDFDDSTLCLNDGEDVRDYRCFSFKLLLTPLSAITDEDAVEVAMLLVGWPDSMVRLSKIKVRPRQNGDHNWDVLVMEFSGTNKWQINYRGGDFYGWRDGNGMTACVLKNHRQAFDYLRSKGYDCGYGDIPSLIEAGLAIDKTTLNN